MIQRYIRAVASLALFIAVLVGATSAYAAPSRAVGTSTFGPVTLHFTLYRQPRAGAEVTPNVLVPCGEASLTVSNPFYHYDIWALSVWSDSGGFVNAGAIIYWNNFGYKGSTTAPEQHYVNPYSASGGFTVFVSGSSSLWAVFSALGYDGYLCGATIGPVYWNQP